MKHIHGSPFDLRIQQAAPDAQTDADVASGEYGYIHSYTTGSAVDGPGMRTVIWTSGCHFRCQYCHNPDTWHLKHGTRVAVDDMLPEIARYARFLPRERTGLTVSGGEPLVQAPFVLNLLQQCKQRGIHTALDTNGYLGSTMSDADLQIPDLYLLDIKSWDPETHLRATGKPVEQVLAFARRLSEHRRPFWLRFVLVPGLTDAPANYEGLADFAATLSGIERVEVLPFHQLGRDKWRKLGIAYPLANTEPPSAELTERVRNAFRQRGLRVPAVS